MHSHIAPITMCSSYFGHALPKVQTTHTMTNIICLLMKPLTRCLLVALMFMATSQLQAADNSKELSEKVILGWIENVHLQPSNLKAKAKLDTGAKTSSIHAKNIEFFEKDGDRWVRFQFANNTRLKASSYTSGKSKKVITIETPLTRSALIKHHKHSSVERPVVTLPFTLNDVEYEAEFTLTDRSKFLYPVLLGRRFLKNVAIVDPGNTFLRTRTIPREESDTAEPAPEQNSQNSTASPTQNKNEKADIAQ
ncbi:hypothetical protein Kalk_18345 [Ketobacter alkanivorans]|uniref:Retropepsin-like aspartic endopeptidase domain-containing protein n=2 Tax=Ketobacter alkanivorans TaxID=1917421 RepID=A0A2K9LPP6_9GAMM|nr:hypothetical protein Kalk_18345 [Ketobacter alkanivorans]